MIDFHTNSIGRIKLQQTGDVQIQNVKQKRTSGARSVVIYTRKKHCHSADEWQMYFSLSVSRRTVLQDSNVPIAQGSIC